MIWGFLALAWASETPGSRSRAPKLHIPVYNATKL